MVAGAVRGVAATAAISVAVLFDQLKNFPPIMHMMLLSSMPMALMTV